MNKSVIFHVFVQRIRGRFSDPFNPFNPQSSQLREEWTMKNGKDQRPEQLPGFLFLPATVLSGCYFERFR